MIERKVDTAIVAGCCGVVGRALVEQLLGSDARVVGLCRPGSEEKIRDLESSSSGRFTVMGGDMLNPSACKDMVEKSCEKLGGKIDTHFHAVGSYDWCTWSDVSPEVIDRLWKSNYTTAWALGREVFGFMSRQGSGSMMFISNRDTQTFAPLGFGPYLAPKAALNMFVQSLAAEGKSKGIRVNAVLPTIIDTQVNRKAMPDKNPSDWVNPENCASFMIDLSRSSRSDITGALIPIHARML